MPIKRYRKLKRGCWQNAYASYLSCSVGPLSDAYLSAMTAAQRADMAAAWPVLRETILASWNYVGQRCLGWWLYEAPKRRNRKLPEVEQLERLGQLSESELETLKLSACGIANEYHEAPFRRSWSWWRFLSPQVRNWHIDEACQLLGMVDELTWRENYIIANGKDIEGIEGMPHLGLTADEREALGLLPCNCKP